MTLEIKKDNLATLVVVGAEGKIAWNVLKPYIEPIFQKIVQRAKEWSATVSESELNHLLFGMILSATFILAGCLTMIYYRHKALREQRRERLRLENKSPLIPIIQLEFE